METRTLILSLSSVFMLHSTNASSAETTCGVPAELRPHAPGPGISMECKRDICELQISQAKSAEGYYFSTSTLRNADTSIPLQTLDNEDSVFSTLTRERSFFDRVNIISVYEDSKGCQIMSKSELQHHKGNNGASLGSYNIDSQYHVTLEN